MTCACYIYHALIIAYYPFLYNSKRIKNSYNILQEVKGLSYRDKVKIALIEKNMSQRDLAKKMNISIVYLTDILAGNRTALDRRKQIAEILEMKEEM